MPTILNEKDLSYIKSVNKQIYKTYFIKVKVLPLLNTNHDTLYGENANRVYGTPYEMEAFIPGVPRYDLRQLKQGADEKRDMKICFSIDLAKEQNQRLPKLGDRIIIQEDTYQVQQDSIDDYGTNLLVPLTHVCTLIRVRPEKLQTETVVTDEY
jgi:hypothetical protein